MTYLSLYFPTTAECWTQKSYSVDFVWLNRIELKWTELKGNEEILSEFFGESRNYGFWSENGTGAEI